MDQDDSSPFSAVTGSKMRTAIASMPADKGAYKNIKTNTDNVDIHQNFPLAQAQAIITGMQVMVLTCSLIFSNCIELSGILILIC